MDTHLARLESEIRRARERLNDLETAARVIRALDNSPSGATPATNATDAARAALVELGREAHYKEIAKEAMRQGYRGDEKLDVVAKAIDKRLRLRHDVFELVGKGVFRLR